MISVLRLGSTGAGVQNWQRFLNQVAHAGLSIDGAFGPKTFEATKTWQHAHGLLVDGIVGKDTRTVAMQREGYIPFLPATNYTPARARTIELIVIHDMEYPEKPEGGPITSASSSAITSASSSALWCAEFFAGAAAPKASAHYAIDNRYIVQCVADHDVAWHAPGANANGIGIEHAGYASQSRDQWLDDYSRSELAISAALVARLAATYGIPIQWRHADELKVKGVRGITGHRDVSLAFGGSHTDPGPNFPIDEYLQLVRRSAP